MQCTVLSWNGVEMLNEYISYEMLLIHAWRDKLAIYRLAVYRPNHVFCLDYKSDSLNMLFGMLLYMTDCGVVKKWQKDIQGNPWKI